MLEFLRKAPRAGLESLAGQIGSTDRTLETPGLRNPISKLHGGSAYPSIAAITKNRLNVSYIYIYQMGLRPMLPDSLFMCQLFSGGSYTTANGSKLNEHRANT